LVGSSSPVNVDPPSPVGLGGTDDVPEEVAPVLLVNGGRASVAFPDPVFTDPDWSMIVPEFVEILPELFTGVSGIVSVAPVPFVTALVEIVHPVAVSEACVPDDDAGGNVTGIGSDTIIPEFASVLHVCVSVAPVLVVGSGRMIGGSTTRGGQTGSTKCPVESEMSLELVAYEN